jgi:hypothetical protein
MDGLVNENPHYILQGDDTHANKRKMTQRLLKENLLEV